MSPIAVTLELRGVLFDMDGVLVSSIRSAERCWKRWAAEFGVANPEQVTIPHGVRAIEIAKLLKPDINPAEGLRRIEEIEVADVSDVELLPGARALLSSLPPERWTIVTSATRPLLLARLNAAGLPVPERLVCGEMVSRGKPDPEPYHMGAEMLGFSPAECLVVEDAPSGVRAGVEAGCRVLGVEGTHRANELRAAGAQWVVSSLERVQGIVAGDWLRLHLQIP